MATRSNIGVKVGNKYKTIYCHWDGYLSWNGQMLLDNYNTQDRVEALVALGDISSLNKSIECPEGHSYDSPFEDCTIAYIRDRGESGVECRESEEKPSLEEEYLYIFEDGQWYVQGWYLDYQPLTQELIDHEQDED